MLLTSMNTYKEELILILEGLLDGHFCMYYVLKAGNLATVDLLLQYGEYPNVKGSNRATSLHYLFSFFLITRLTQTLRTTQDR